MFFKNNAQKKRDEELRKSLPYMKLDKKSTSTAKLKLKSDKRLLGIMIGIIVVFIYSIFILNFKIIKVSGHSMDPTLHNGEYFIAKKHEPIKRFEIVILNEREKTNGNSKDIVKRVIGLPGDKIAVIDGHLYVNDREYFEPYIDSHNINNFKKLDWTITVPKDHVFVLGDNRDISKDSRIVGSFKKSSIVGVKIGRMK